MTTAPTRLALLLAAVLVAAHAADAGGDPAPGQAAPQGEEPIGTWSSVWTPPKPWSRHTATYDPGRDRIVVYGGFDGTSASPRAHAVLLDPPLWTMFGLPPVAAGSRSFHSTIVDPIRRRLVVFGGWRGHGLDDVWTCSLDGPATWTRLFPAGPGPGARHGHTAILDASRDRMIVFGGSTPDLVFSNEVWALSLGAPPAWTKLAPAGPPPSGRALHVAVADPSRDRMIVHGGNAGAARDDTWALSLAGETQWIPLASAGDSPGARFYHAAVLDPARDRMLVVGGYGPALGYRSDTWSLALDGSPAWTALSPAGTPPAPRTGHSLVLDPGRDRLVLQGGRGAASNELLDAWTLTLGGSPAWAPLAIGGVPAPRENHVAIFDPGNARMIVHGGDTGGANGELWEFVLEPAPAWRRLAPTGPAPAARFGHVAILDPAARRMIVHGGSSSSGAGDLLDDAWALSLAGPPSWSPLAPPGPRPAARRDHVGVHDALRHALVLHGGWDGSARGDTWTLPLSPGASWAEIPSPGTAAAPVPRFAHMALADPDWDRAIVHGGSSATSGLLDVWQLSFSSFTPWSAAIGSSPWRCADGTLVADLGRRRALLFGGFRDGTRTASVLHLVLGGSLHGFASPTTAGITATPRARHTAVLDAARHRMIVWGGAAPGPTANDVEVLSWGGTVGVPHPPPAPEGAASTVRVFPNPSTTGVRLSFRTTSAGWVRLRILDVAGRRVGDVVDEWLPAGGHEAAWDRRRVTGAMSPAGVYVAVLEAGGVRIPRRFVLVR
jgi:hypothetical protein